MFGGAPKVERPDPPPTTPTEARPSIAAAGLRAIQRDRLTGRNPALSLIGASTGTRQAGTMMERRGSYRRRSLIGGGGQNENIS